MASPSRSRASPPGVDTDSIVDQLMAIEPPGHDRASRTASTRVTRQQTALKAIASPSSTALKTAADGSRAATPPGSRPRPSTRRTRRKRRRHADRRRRHRRPHAPGQPARVLGAARLLVRRAATAGTLTISTARPATRPDTMTVAVAANATLQQIADAINANDDRARRRRRRQERQRRRAPRPLLAQDRLELGLHGRPRRPAHRRTPRTDATTSAARRRVLARRRRVARRLEDQRRSRTRSPACA